jgi:hypothetical protein
LSVELLTTIQRSPLPDFWLEHWQGHVFQSVQA